MGYRENKRIYIVDALERKMNFPTTIETLKVYSATQQAVIGDHRHEILVETVGYQESFAQQMKLVSALRIEGMKPSGSKTERLTLITDLIKNGSIIFIRTPAVERLVEQMIGFQQETHDDLVDAFTMMVTKTMSEPDSPPVFRITCYR